MLPGLHSEPTSTVRQSGRRDTRGELLRRIASAPSLRHFLIHLDVLFAGLGPGIILGHAVAHEGVPCVLILKNGERALYGSQIIVGIIALEFEAGAGFRFGVPFFHCVIEAAGGADYWNRSILKAVDLVQAAWLIARRHEVDVGAGVNLVRQRLVVGDANGNLFREPFMQGAEEVFVIWLACAQDDEKDVLECQPLDNLRGQVEAFLRGEAGDDAEHRCLLFDMGSSEGVQQVAPAVGFAAEVFDRVVRGDFAVGFLGSTWRNRHR